MAKKWYPVIDYLTCVECGTCIAKCPHKIYDLSNGSSPKVVNPDACVDHCHGCGNKCPVGAITYVGDDTGWTPPNGEDTEEIACCCNEAKANDITKIVEVEYLYLDLSTCDRCLGADQVLDEVLLTLTPALQFAGYPVKLSKVKIETEQMAEQYHFYSSPTIRVNGNDICITVQENNCSCCGEISGTQTDCRVFEYQGNTYEIPPKEMLAQAILQEVFHSSSKKIPIKEYDIPDNLRRFFDGKSNQQKCDCGGGSCCG